MPKLILQKKSILSMYSMEEQKKTLYVQKNSSVVWTIIMLVGTYTEYNIPTKLVLR